MPQNLTPLPSVAFAVETILGGTTPAARRLTELTGERVTKQTVSTWKRIDSFPAKYMALLAPILIEAGYEPAPKHFGQRGVA